MVFLCNRTLLNELAADIWTLEYIGQFGKSHNSETSQNSDTPHVIIRKHFRKRQPDSF
jgi:hypothetical protein